jgi:hypothetical protein
MASDNDFQHARPENPECSILLPAINEKIDHVVGSTPTLILRPPRMSRIVISIEVGSFAFKPGDHVALPLATTAPGATTFADTLEEGTGRLLLSKVANDSHEVFVLPMPDQLTVVGSAGGDILTFWFIP